MLNDSQIELKYHIIYVGKQRYYREDLSERNFNLECTTPYSLEVAGKCFIESSWKQLLINVSTQFLSDDPSKREALLAYRMSWNDKPVFSDIAAKHWNEIGENTYLLCNQTALHACWLLRDILLLFDIDLSKAVFVIHRPPFSEPAECRQFYETKTKNAFRYYYTQLLKKPEEKAEQVLRNIDKLNKYLSEFSLAYDNFYLIDNNNVYASYKAKFLDHLRFTKGAEEKIVILADKYLTILGDFYKTIR